MKIQKLALFLVKIAITAGIIWYLKDSFDISQFSKIKREAPLLLLVMPLAWILNQIFIAIRLKLLLLAAGMNIPTFTLIRATFISFLVSSLVPGIVGADLSRIMMLSPGKGKGRFVDLAAIVIFDRLLGLVALLAVSTIASLSLDFRTFTNNQMNFVWIVWLSTAVSLVGYLSLMFIRNLLKSKSSKIEHFSASFLGRMFLLGVRVAKQCIFPLRTFAMALLLSLVAVSSLVFGQVILAEFLMATDMSNFALLSMIYPASVVVSVIPITPMGIGVTQLALGEIFSLFSLPSQVGLTTVSLSQISQALVAIGLGIPAIWLYRPRARKEASVIPANSDETSLRSPTSGTL